MNLMDFYFNYIIAKLVVQTQPFKIFFQKVFNMVFIYQNAKFL